MADWRNVGNWHWKEKNCFDWAKGYFTERLTSISVTKDGKEAKVTSVDSVSGDVDLNIRKGRLITIFDVEIKLAWSAKDLKNEENEANGSIVIPEVAHDTDDYVYDISSSGLASDKLYLKDFVRKELTPQISEVLKGFAGDLKKEHGSEMYIPDNKDTANGSSAIDSNLAQDFKQGKVGSSSSDGGVSVTKTKDSMVSTVSLSQSVEFICSAEDLFLTLTDPQRISVWSRAKADAVPEEGKVFSMFGGHISGKFTKIVPNKSIEQTWRVNTWPAGHYSDVVITLEQLSSSTRLSLKQTGVPFNEEDATKMNWDRYYWNAIKAAFGIGGL